VSLHAETERLQHGGQLDRRPIVDRFAQADHQAIERQREEHLGARPVGDLLQDQQSSGVEPMAQLIEKAISAQRGPRSGLASFIACGSRALRLDEFCQGTPTPGCGFGQP
jgi:hypothetical protein